MVMIKKKKPGASLTSRKYTVHNIFPEEMNTDHHEDAMAFAGV